MRMMRVVVRDWQSGGVIAAVALLCLLLQAFSSSFAMAAISASDDPQFVICRPASPAADIDGKDLPAAHQCCLGMCQLVSTAVEPGDISLGKAFAALSLPALVPDHWSAPPVALLRRLVQPRAPPLSV